MRWQGSKPPIPHGQPDAFIAGQKGCGGCHTMELVDQSVRQTEGRKYYRYGMDCQDCHTRHAFSVKEAREPEACMTCHMGFNHPQWEMWSSSKHGVTCPMDREAHRGPKCQDCHMPGGDHCVRTALGFLGLNLTTDDKELVGVPGPPVSNPPGRPLTITPGARAPGAASRGSRRGSV